MHREAMSKPSQALRCGRCGMALPPDCADCPHCGQPVMLRSDSGAPGSGDGVRREPAGPAARATQPLHRRVSAALPRRLTAADPNGARSWGLSASAAVILFGFAIGFGTFVVMSDHESAQEWWRPAETPRYADEAPAAAVRSGELADTKDSPSSTLTSPPLSQSPSSDSLVALLQQQIDSARKDDATDALHAKGVGGLSPQHDKVPLIAPRAAPPETSLASSDSVRQPARAKGLPQAQAEVQVAQSAVPQTMPQTMPQKTPQKTLQKTLQAVPQQRPQSLAADKRSGQEPDRKVQAPEAISAIKAPVPVQSKPTADTHSPASATASTKAPISPEISMKTPAPIAAVQIARAQPQPPSSAVHTKSDEQPFAAKRAQAPATASTKASISPEISMKTPAPIVPVQIARAQPQPPSPAVHTKTDEQRIASKRAQAPATASTKVPISPEISTKSRAPIAAVQIARARPQPPSPAVHTKSDEQPFASKRAQAPATASTKVPISPEISTKSRAPIAAVQIARARPQPPSPAVHTKSDEQPFASKRAQAPATASTKVPISPEISTKSRAPIAAVQIARARPQPPSPAVHTKSDEQRIASKRAQAPATAPGPTAPPGMLSAQLTAPTAKHQQATTQQQAQKHAARAPAACGMEGASPCKAASVAVNSHSETHGTDRARKVRIGSVVKNVQVSLPSRAATPNPSVRTRPVERIASVQPKHAPRRTHHRPHVETAQQEPFFAPLQHRWRFEMPKVEGHTDLSQTQLDLYRGN